MTKENFFTFDKIVRCLVCGHSFYPGNLLGSIYCPNCGRRFNPYAHTDETVNISSFSDNTTLSFSENNLKEDKNSTIDLSHTTRFGDYDLIAEIARGGMGVVYRARQRMLKRIVALKVLKNGDDAKEEEKERLFREATAAAGLIHPNIVPIHEFSTWKGKPYLTMDFIEGEPLDRLLEQGPLNVKEAFSIIETVARAIDYAHSKNIIHRDLKPANIIIDQDGRPMVTDFGLAVNLLASNNDERMTKDGSIMGTIPYIPPEQASGKVEQIDERSDIYSLGAVLYELLTGKPPFSGFTQFELLRRVINQDPVSPRTLNSRVHADAETICLKCLEKDPNMRYQSAKELADDCLAFIRGEVISARPSTLFYRLKKHITRRPLLSLSIVCSLFFLTIAWIGLLYSHDLSIKKKETEKALEDTIARVVEISKEKEETDKKVRRDWRSEYNINFDYAFRWEGDQDRSLRLEVPWLNIRSARLLISPPRLSLFDIAGESEAKDFTITPLLGLPFSFPGECKFTVRIQVPDENNGELFLLLDTDKNFKSRVGTIVARFGSSKKPGVTIYRDKTILKEDLSFFLKSNSTAECVVERSNGKISLHVDGQLLLEVDDFDPLVKADAGYLSIDVKHGKLEFLELFIEVKSMSLSLIHNLLETAQTLSSRGRTDLSLKLYESILLEPIDAASKLNSLRGFARSLWLGLPRSERKPSGIEAACQDLKNKLASSGRLDPGEAEYLTALSLSLNPFSLKERLLALEKLKNLYIIPKSENTGLDFKNLAYCEAGFVYLRLAKTTEAVEIFRNILDNNIASDLYNTFGSSLLSDGRLALLLEAVDQLISKAPNSTDLNNINNINSILNIASIFAPNSREIAQRYRNLSNLYNQLNKLHLALDSLLKAQAISPDWYLPYIDEIKILYEHSQYQQATEVVKSLEKKFPNSLELHLSLASLYLDELPDSGQNALTALSASQIAIDLTQQLHPGAFELKSRALIKLNRLEEAKEAINAAIKLEKTELRENILTDITKLQENNKH